MYRKAEQDLEKWRLDDNKKALLVTGARQIGKTFLVRELGKKYKHFIEINFITQPNAMNIFEGDLNANTIILNLTAFTQEKLDPGNTLIFFDEIQECPNARTAIKFLVEDGRFDYVASGSLLRVRYKEVKSYPVGFEHELRMYPMDFEEFCIANGLQQEIIEYLQDCYETHDSVSEPIHETMIRLFQYYVVTGGMPDVVQRFIDTHDMQEVISVQNDILSLYRQDISRYALNQRNRITEIFDRIPSQLDEKNRRFQLSSINKNARTRDYEDSFLWLRDAGVALPCYNVMEPRAPLKINEQSRLFKLFMNDCGLLCCASMENIQYSILQGDLSVNMGSILENVIAQQLVSNGFSLRYFNKNRIGELDFVIQKGSDVVPLEIKSGNDYKKHAAIDNALKVSEWNLADGIVFCKGNVAQDGRIIYLPWYMIMFMKQDRMKGDSKVVLDLSNLKI